MEAQVVPEQELAQDQVLKERVKAVTAPWLQAMVNPPILETLMIHAWKTQLIASSNRQTKPILKTRS